MNDEFNDMNSALNFIRRLPDMELSALLHAFAQDGAGGGFTMLKALLRCAEGGTVTLLPDPNEQSREEAQR